MTENKLNENLEEKVLTNEEKCIKRAKKNNKRFNEYDLSKMGYISLRKNITIIHKVCNTEYVQKADDFATGIGCSKCYGSKQKTNEEAIEELKTTRGTIRYDYRYVKYKTANSLIKILCLVCNKTSDMQFYNFKNGQNCGHCYRDSRMNKNNFIEKFQAIHGIDKYDYSQSVYVDSETKINIKCNKCKQIFSQLPTAHLSGQNCGHCHPAKKSNNEEFIKKAKAKHKDHNYDYSKVVYVNTITKVIIGCDECKKDFNQKPKDHLKGARCPYCHGTPKKTTEQFVKEMEEKYGNQYSYDLVVYDTNAIKVSMICNECENIFKTTPNHLLRKIGCPYCKKKTEMKLANWLKDQEYKFDREYKFPDLGLLRFDFYLKDYFTIIEIDGAQHFKQVSNWTPPELTQANDILKMKYCINNGISVIRLLQEDVYNKDKDYWKPRFKDAMQMIFEKPTIEFIDEKNEYKHLKELMANYKPDDMSDDEIIEELNEVSEKIKQFKITTRNKLKEKARKRIEEQIKESQQ